MKKINLTWLGVLITICSYAQDETGNKPARFYLAVSTNLRTPGNDTGMSPIISFKSFNKKNIQLGGVGVSGIYYIPFHSRCGLKAVVGVSRQSYWNTKVLFNKGPNPQDQLGIGKSKTIEYYGNVGGLFYYRAWKKLSVGTGMMLQASIWSGRYVENVNVPVKNSEFRPMMPTVPLEICWAGSVMLYNIRYENGILNRYHGDLSEYYSNNYGLISFEAGVRI